MHPRTTSCFKMTRAERVYGREERFFGSSHCPTDSQAWAKGDDESKNSASVTSPSQEAGICCEQESCILRAGQCLEGHCSRTARRYIHPRGLKLKGIHIFIWSERAVYESGRAERIGYMSGLSNEEE